ncbi:MAG TPA: hypothetical protein VF092_26280 [Longimicrobium sp.]
MAMLLTRERSTGTIRDNGTSIVLCGGAASPFGSILEYWGQLLENGVQPFVVTFPQPGADPNPDGCFRDHTSPQLLPRAWRSRTAMLDALKAYGCNLLRVFLSNGVTLANGAVTGLYPFARANGAWRVAAAIRDNDPTAWSQPWFDRLRSFVADADARGVALQLCLFSFHDMRNTPQPVTFSYWPHSWWNPAQIDAPEWGKANLVSVNTEGQGLDERMKARLRSQDFLNTGRLGLMAVQKRIVEKVLAAVKPYGNVIVELINEPQLLADTAHPAAPDPGVYQARWLNLATGWITDWCARNGNDWRPLISANAAPPVDGAALDVDTWAARGELAGYAELDAISYHGLTGYPAGSVGEAHCGTTHLPRYDRDSIQARVTEHGGRHRGKALVFSTDAVLDAPQTYPGTSGTKVTLYRRDGQVRTTLGYDEVVSIGTERARNDLDNWAYRVLKHAFARPGTVHFQNHSSVKLSFQAIGAAAAAAQGAPPPPPPPDDYEPDLEPVGREPIEREPLRV